MSDVLCFVFFFNDTATTEIYTLSLHDALPIYRQHAVAKVCANRIRIDRDGQLKAAREGSVAAFDAVKLLTRADARIPGDRKSTRLNSSHANISYAVFCLKKKKLPHPTPRTCTR